MGHLQGFRGKAESKKIGNDDLNVANRLTETNGKERGAPPPPPGGRGLQANQRVQNGQTRFQYVLLGKCLTTENGAYFSSGQKNGYR